LGDSAIRYVTEKSFRSSFEKLPTQIQEIASHAINHPDEPQYRKQKRGKQGNVRANSIRICIKNNEYRAFAEINGDECSWYFIGDHGAYDKFMRG
jgi:hypothetical protein